MSGTAQTKAEQLPDLHHDGNRYELVRGKLRVMSPSGWRHGSVVGNLSAQLG